MIIRIVKMKFKADKVDNFIQLFEETKENIRNFEGVLHLELLRETRNSSTFFTYSHWNSEEDLENYRNSALFKSVWTRTKALFEEKAEAWSTNRLYNLE